MQPPVPRGRRWNALDARPVVDYGVVMTMARPLIVSASVLGISILTVFAGCSSSSTHASGNDAGGGSDTGTHVDASGSSSGGSSSGGNDSGGGGDSSGDDSGGTCPDNTPYTSETYATAVAHQGKCEASDIAAFVAVCGDNYGTGAGCTAWWIANVAGDAGTGTACGNCIAAPGNNGGSWSDPTSVQGSEAFPNYGACIQLLDPTNGPACAAALDNISACEGLQCDDCPDGDTYTACQATVDAAICSTYNTTWESACTTDDADGGVGSTCSPGSASMAYDPDFTFIINLVCGSVGSDAGGG